MSSREYNYDDQGAFFPYFIFTITALITLPLTYSLRKPTDEIEKTAPRIRTDYKPPQHDRIAAQKNKQWRRERRLKRIVTVGIGYLTMGLMLYLIKISETDTPSIWDPYSILKLSTSSSEAQIKKRFRDLSRTLHPDKAQPDPTKNETIETVNDQWVEITKAFKALTDEEVRSNYEKYGNPDGRQSFSIGIALPKMIVNEGSGKYVLLVYGALLGVLLPYFVGSWWYGTQRLTKEKVLRATASDLFREYEENMSDGDMVNAMSSGQEYQEVFATTADTGIGIIDQSIFKDGEEGFTVAGLSPQDQEKVKGYEGVRRKAAGLIWAFLGRIQLDGGSLDDEKYEAAPIAHKLVDSFLAITLAFGNTAPLLSAYRTSQHLIQAIPPRGSPLLQLPHVTPEIARSIEAPLARPYISLQQLMSMPEYKRRKLCTDQPAPVPQLGIAEYNSAMAVARQLPFLQVEKAFFRVMGERFITPGSLVQFIVKARVVPPGSMNIPDVNPTDLEDLDPEEGDLDALMGRRSVSRGKGAQMQVSSNVSPDKADKPLVPPLAHAPYFPRDHSPRYHIFLADSKMGKIAVPPFTMTTFDKPLFDADTGLPTFAMQTFRMQFQAPPQQGAYSFVMHVVCDSYIGADSQQDITLHVESAEKAAEISSEEDISEPEEDSLAGQMRAMQSGNLTGAGAGAKKTKGKKRVVEVESSDEDESATDEEESDPSATDTETEDED